MRVSCLSYVSAVLMNWSDLIKGCFHEEKKKSRDTSTNRETRACNPFKLKAGEKKEKGEEKGNKDEYPGIMERLRLQR